MMQPKLESDAVVVEEEEEGDQEQKAFLSDTHWAREGGSRSRHERGSTTAAVTVWYYLRFILEIAMAVVIVGLLSRVLRERERGCVDDDEAQSPVPKFPRRTYTFRPDPTFVRDDMLFSEQDTLDALHNWLPLSSEARGYVKVPNASNYPLLSDPYTVPIDRVTSGPAYMMSVFHQLHCLSYIVDHYRQGYGAGANLTEDVAHHSAHCFDYLRQSIMCAGDTNLEGQTADGPGWGSRHTCVDYDALLDWANERAAMKWRTGLLPGTAIL
ncbi:hypothetical protein GGR50DRAFT_658582 [Xylaria sp. CBS 124048]|nr:hypothetical protein GGR50DRAFT_658582 [Xylaria sp. CBS 124048]